MEWTGPNGRGVGSPSYLSPLTYIDNFQIILKTYIFDLRFEERTAVMLQREEFAQGRKTEKKIKKNPVGEEPRKEPG